MHKGVIYASQGYIYRVAYIYEAPHIKYPVLGSTRSYRVLYICPPGVFTGWGLGYIWVSTGIYMVRLGHFGGYIREGGLEIDLFLARKGVFGSSRGHIYMGSPRYKYGVWGVLQGLVESI